MTYQLTVSTRSKNMQITVLQLEKSTSLENIVNQEIWETLRVIREGKACTCCHILFLHIHNEIITATLYLCLCKNIKILRSLQW